MPLEMAYVVKKCCFRGIECIPVPVYLACTCRNVSIDVKLEPLETHSAPAAYLRYISTRTTVSRYVEQRTERQKHKSYHDGVCKCAESDTATKLARSRGFNQPRRPRKSYRIAFFLRRIMSTDTAKIRSKLAKLDRSLDELEAQLEPLFAQSLPETLLALDTIQQAKLQTVIPYVVYDLVFGK